MTGSTCSCLICDEDYDKYVCDCQMVGCYMVLEEHYRVYPCYRIDEGNRATGKQN